MAHISRRDALKLSLSGVLAQKLTNAATAANYIEYMFGYERVCGTSLDIKLKCTQTLLQDKLDEVIFAEVDRLCGIFSLYDENSEISRVNKTQNFYNWSDEFRHVYQSTLAWQKATNNACHVALGKLKSIWKNAEDTQSLPSRESVKSINISNTQTLLDLNAGAKGYIIQRIQSVIQRNFPGLFSGYVNLGGDIAVWGTSRNVSIQNPLESADNAKPLGTVTLQNKAIATSGGYQRYYTINGQRYSHIINPRTGWTADGVASATVIAQDTITANILATSLCVMAPMEAVNFINSMNDVECLLVKPNGETLASSGFHWQPYPQDTLPASIIADNPWPADFEVKVTLELPTIEGARRYRRPYVAVWVENAEGKPVRTLSVWGNSNKYLKDLGDWWKFAKEDKDLVKAVTRATRGPGKYELLWDGKDDKGNVLGQGTYTIKVEVHREFGKHLRQSGKIECKGEAANVKVKKNEETAETIIDYAKKKKQ